MLGRAAFRKVNRADLVTGALFGTEVAPISDKQLNIMKADAVRAEGIWASGTPACVYWLFLGAKADPAFLAYSKPVISVARETRPLPPPSHAKHPHHNTPPPPPKNK